MERQNRCREWRDPKPSLPQIPTLEICRLILLAVCAILSSEPLTSQSQGLSEHEIKAGFLFNFTKFVEWPEGTFADASTPIILGVVGENPFGNLLIETAAGKFVNGRPVVVRQFKDGQDLRSWNVLFITETDKKRMMETLGKLKGSQVLTVGEGSGFTQSGGMIALLVEGNRVRLEIDVQTAAEAHLKISAKVIAVARLVARDAREKN